MVGDGVYMAETDTETRKWKGEREGEGLEASRMLKYQFSQINL